MDTKKIREEMEQYNIHEFYFALEKALDELDRLNEENKEYKKFIRSDKDISDEYKLGLWK